MSYSLYYQRRLPHYQPQGGTLFITFRLNFSIPAKFVQAYNSYLESLKSRKAENTKEILPDANIQKMLFAFTDDMYSQIEGDFSLTETTETAELLAEEILSLQDSYYFLFAFTIMPNHVHLLVKPRMKDGKVIAVAEIMRKLKGASARKINLLLKREGAVWHREYYDHWVRDSQELVNVIDYIRRNPLKAKLVEDADKWQWTWINKDLERGGI